MSSKVKETASTVYLRAPTPKGMVVYDPLPSQLEFHTAEDKYRVYIGGMGAGKTLANCVEAFLMAMEYPGSVGLLGRWSYKELEATTWETLKTIVPKKLVVSECCSQQKTRMEIRAPGGKISRIHGWNLSNWKSLTSLNLDWFGVDEVTELDNEKTWQQLEARLRGPVGPHRGWGSGTPNGQDWVWQRFVKRKLCDYRAIQAPTSQNIHNPDGYEQTMRRANANDPNWVARFLDAQFNVFEGQIFFAWDEQVHVIHPFPIPAHWPRFLAVDPGLADACAALLFATDEAGFIYVIDEFYQSGKTIDEQCAGILKMVGGAKLDWAVIDPSARQRDAQSGKSRIQMYRDGGLPVVEANNDIDASIEWIRKHLAVDQSRIHPITGASGSPGVFVFKNCTHLREEVPGWAWGKNGRARDGNNHAIDAWRYGMMRRPHPAEPLQAVEIRPSAKLFWDSLMDDLRDDLPLIGAGAGGRMG